MVSLAYGTARLQERRHQVKYGYGRIIPKSGFLCPCSFSKSAVDRDEIPRTEFIGPPTDIGRQTSNINDEVVITKLSPPQLLPRIL